MKTVLPPGYSYNEQIQERNRSGFRLYIEKKVGDAADLDLDLVHRIQ